MGLLWDIVKPLVKQTSSSQPPQSSQALVQCVKTPVKRQTSVIRPSQSFIQERKISFSRSQNCDETDSEEEDMEDVFSGLSSDGEEEKENASRR